MPTARHEASIAAPAAFGVRAGLFKDEPVAADPSKVAERDVQRRMKAEEDRQQRVGKRLRVKGFDGLQPYPHHIVCQARQAGRIRESENVSDCGAEPRRLLMITRARTAENSQ